MQSSEKITITWTPEMLREIREAVQKGEFASTSDALRDAVHVWQRQRLEAAERVVTIRARVRRSLDDPRPDLDEDEVDRHFAELHAETMKAYIGAKA